MYFDFVSGKLACSVRARARARGQWILQFSCAIAIPRGIIVGHIRKQATADGKLSGKWRMKKKEVEPRSRKQKLVATLTRALPPSSQREKEKRARKKERKKKKREKKGEKRERKKKIKEKIARRGKVLIRPRCALSSNPPSRPR